MCLKKFIRYTFSNREAFDRLVGVVEKDYGMYLPKGEIYVIQAYWSWGVKMIKENRDSWSYDNLMDKIELPFFPLFKHLEYFSFLNWEEWRQTKEDVGDNQDVFGYVDIELQ